MNVDILLYHFLEWILDDFFIFWENLKRLYFLIVFAFDCISLQNNLKIISVDFGPAYYFLITRPSLLVVHSCNRFSFLGIS